MQLARILDRVYLRVGGLTIHVSSAELPWPIVPAPAASRFLVEPSTADVEIDVHARRCDVPGGPCLFESGGPWRLYRHAGGYRFVFVANRSADPYKIADFNPEFSDGVVTIHEPFFAGVSSIDPLEYPLDELLIVSWLGRGLGVELHGCGVLDGSDGHLFVGQSGAGKTTTARLWLDVDGAVVLSDDRVIVRAEEGGLWMYGTPWHGDEPLASPRRARLTNVFLLRQLDRHALAPLSAAAAVARLFAASFPAFHDRAALAFTLAFLERIAASVPVRELGFTPGRSLIDFVRSA